MSEPTNQAAFQHNYFEIFRTLVRFGSLDTRSTARYPFASPTQFQILKGWTTKKITCLKSCTMRKIDEKHHGFEGSKHIKNATWPEGCGQRNEKTRKRENQKTEKTEKTRKREIENQKTGTLLAVFGFLWFSPFSRFRVFAVFAFSPLSRFRVFAVFAFSPFSRFSCFRRFRVFAVFAVFASTGWFLPFSGFRVFVFTGAFTCSVLAFSCYRMDCFGTYFTHAQSCDNVRVHSATEWTASVHTLRMPKAVITFVFIVLRNGLLRYIPYACPKLW